MPADLDIVSWSSITALNFIIPLSYNFTSTVFTYHSSSTKQSFCPSQSYFPFLRPIFFLPSLKLNFFFSPVATRTFTFLVAYLPSVSASTLFHLHCTSALPSRLPSNPIYIYIYNLTMLLIPLYYLYNLPTGSPLNSPAHPWRQPHPS